MNRSTRVEQQPFGTMPNGIPIELFTISNARIEARVITYGGILVSLKVPDRNGELGDVVLGFDTLDEYVSVNNSPDCKYFGAIIGRYANRIAGGEFQLDGKTYSVPVNNGPNSLHGGPNGFHNVVWQGKPIPSGVELRYLSKDGEAGYPGNLDVTVRYTIQESALRIDYSAATDRHTVVNLSHHSYFNLAGQGCGDILDHNLIVRASTFTPVNSRLTPTGELKLVHSTPFDFRGATRIGERIHADDEQLRLAGGYDHNWMLDSQGGKLAYAASVYEQTTGRLLNIATTQPGIQFYSGNVLDGSLRGKGGAIYPRHAGLCLETQHFPDSPNHLSFPSSELSPGQEYRHTTIYACFVESPRATSR